MGAFKDMDIEFQERQARVPVRLVELLGHRAAGYANHGDDELADLYLALWAIAIAYRDGEADVKDVVAARLYYLDRNLFPEGE